jgi:hypothetical protein
VDSQAVEQGCSLEAEPAHLDARAAEVFVWRVDQLERAGYSGEFATELADSVVDLHLACDLLRDGCPEGTAYAILS